MLNEFKQFIARGNVIDLAVAVIVGAAFGAITTSLVDGVLMPPLGLVLGRVDFSSLFYVLDHSSGTPISLADAKAKGIPVIAYGQLINDIVKFLIIAFAVFMLVKAVNSMKAAQAPAPEGPTTRDCPYCLSTIPLRATRCAHCTADIKGA